MNCVKGQKKRERVHFKAGTSAKLWNLTAQEPALNVVEHLWHPSRIRRDHLLWPGKETKLLLPLQGGRRPGRQHTLKCFPLLLLCEQLSWKTRSRCVEDSSVPSFWYPFYQWVNWVSTKLDIAIQATQAVMVKPGFDSTAETSPWALRHFSPPRSLSCSDQQVSKTLQEGCTTQELTHLWRKH